MDELRHKFAVEVVTEIREVLMSTCHTKEEALGVIYVLLKNGVLTQMHKEVEEYEAEIEAVIKSQLGETQD